MSSSLPGAPPSAALEEALRGLALLGVGTRRASVEQALADEYLSVRVDAAGVLLAGS